MAEDDNENFWLVTILLVLVVVGGLSCIIWAINGMKTKRAAEGWQTDTINGLRAEQDVLVPAVREFVDTVKPKIEQVITNQQEVLKRIDVVEKTNREIVAGSSSGKGNTVVIGGDQRVTIGSCVGILQQNSTSFGLSCKMDRPGLI
jgi:hypothetical protein